MSYIINLYKKSFLVRYDFDVAIPYYFYTDFKGLKQKEGTFNNVHDNEIHYYEYFYTPIRFKKVIIFLPGIGPGHRAYLREINELALKGYRVITLDYQGCGYSKGENLYSINQPTIDTIQLIKELNLKDEIVLVGHSLGAYTALNVINKVHKISKAVIMSGFLNEKYGMKKFVKLNFIASKIAKYEKKLNPEFKDLDNLKFLKNTSKNILFIHSKDDPTISYKLMIGKIAKLKNNHLELLSLDNKKHNPNFTVEAVNYKIETVDKYFTLVNKGILKTDEERIAFFKDVKLKDLTEQDPEVIRKIINFIG